MLQKEFEINSVEELSQVSEYLFVLREESDIIAFYGPMGAGKTTLIKNLCHRMGVTDEVNSPTFAIVNEYALPEPGKSLYHFDFYRIKQLSEVYDIGYEDYFYSGNPCFLEWPELIEDLLPIDVVRIHINVKPDDTRVLTIDI